MTKKLAKQKRALFRRGSRNPLQMLAACGILVGSFALQSCEKDVLTGQPSWLGNSIYERLEEGITVDGKTLTFNTTLKLIDDLNYKETLSKTGSKTVFVASDEAYEKWFKSSNSWNVTSYDQLTTSQKKQLFNGTMINNAYLLELMSNIPSTSSTKDPEEGMCMRRETATSIYDNVPVVKLEDFPYNETIAMQHAADATVPNDPANIAWANVRSQGKDIHIFKDATSAPMIHFLPKFMKKNSITAEDLEVISNGESTSIEDSWINGKKVISDEQTCKNGYVYVIDGVMESNPSMAEIINDNDQTKIWSRLLKRFSVPVAMNKTTMEEFGRLYQEYKGDSVYNLRYLNQSGNHGLATPTGNADDAISASGLLKFDPGWNQYMADNNTIVMGNDAAAMLVPTDEALTDWFTNGGGKSLYEKFGSWDAIPYETLVKLLNVNMIESFVSSVPSKFAAILDDSQRSMGVSSADIVRCYMGCNGVVYLTNKVFQPSEFSSVMYPANIQSTGVFSVIYHALTGNYTRTQDTSKDFSPYLTAMDSRFSLILPYNVLTSYKSSVNYPVFRFIDPCSYGYPQQWLMEFYFANNKIAGYAYPCTIDKDGTVTVDTSSPQTMTDAAVANRLYDLIDNSTVIEDISADKSYYLTKAGSAMKAYAQGDEMCFQGGFQLETGEVVKVPKDNQYYMGAAGTGNGTTYGVSGDKDADPTHIDVPMTASKSVYQVLKEEADNNGDSLFYKMIFADESAAEAEATSSTTSAGLYGTKDGSYYCCNPTDNFNITLFDNYNYTVYVPTDKAINEMIQNGSLPTWEDYTNASTEEEKTKIADRIHSFVRYHVQDNSVFVGGDKLSDTQYESSKLNTKNNRFYSLTISQDGSGLSVKDQLGNVRNVITSGGFYNKACREYWINTSKVTPSYQKAYNYTIASSSNAVVHKIDGVLLYDQSQLSSWRYGAKGKK